MEKKPLYTRHTKPVVTLAHLANFPRLYQQGLKAVVKSKTKTVTLPQPLSCI